MRWLISFQYKAWFAPKNGAFSGGHPVDAFDLIDEHPALFIANMRRKYDAWRDQERGREDRCDELVRVHSVVAVPDGVLTEEQAEALL